MFELSGFLQFFGVGGAFIFSKSGIRQDIVRNQMPVDLFFSYSFVLLIHKLYFMEMHTQFCV